MGVVQENIGVAGPEHPGEAAAPLRRIPLYAQAEKVLEDLLVRQRYRIGDRIPPEVELTQKPGRVPGDHQGGGRAAGRSRIAGQAPGHLAILLRAGARGPALVPSRPRRRIPRAQCTALRERSVPVA